MNLCFGRTLLLALLVGLLWKPAAPLPAQAGMALSMYLYQQAEQRGDLAAAEKHLDRLIKDEPDNPLYRAQRAYLRSQRGNIQGAVADSRQVIKDYPTLSIGYLNLLQAQAMESTADDHLQLVRATQEKVAEDPVGLTAVASHLHYLGRYTEAMDLVDKAIEQIEERQLTNDDYLPRTIAYRALLHYENGDPEKAIAALAEAQRRFPGNEDVEETRLELLISEGRLPEALVFFKKLFKSRPKNSLNTWFDRAQAHYMTGQYTKAREDMEEALRRSPVDSHTRVVIPGLMILEGKPVEAEKFLNENFQAILRDKVSARQTSNSLVNRRQDGVTLEMLGISTINPYYNRSLARALQGKLQPAIEDAARAAKGDSQFHPYEPAADLEAALRAGARIKLDPKPLDPGSLPLAPEAGPQPKPLGTQPPAQ